MGWVRAFFLPVSAALLVAAALLVPLPVFLEAPGRPVSLGEGVRVAGEEALDGDYLLLSVRLPRGTVFGLARSLFDDSVSRVPPQRIVPSGVSDRDFFERQRTVFEVSGEIAAAVGLRAAGVMDQPIEPTGNGAVIVEVVAGSPAEGQLRPGDVIVEANGQTVRTDADLRDLIPADDPDPEVLRLRLRRAQDERTVEVQPRVMDVGDGQQRPVIGVMLQTHEPTVDLPVEVEIDTGPIGGPSAGLMIALTVYDKVDDEVDLARGRLVAGTGGITTDGAVTSIGGIRQKVIAADRQQAAVFLAPAAQFDQASAALPAGSPMEVVSVETFDQAVEVLLQTAGTTALAAPTAA